MPTTYADLTALNAACPLLIVDTNGVVGPALASVTLQEFFDALDALLNTSVLTDNGDGTYNHDDGAGNITVIQGGFTSGSINAGVVTLTYPDASTFDIDICTVINNCSIDSLSDVDTTTALPSVNETLVWDGVNWVPGSNGGNTSTITNNGDGTYDHDDGTGNITVIQGGYTTVTLDSPSPGDITFTYPDASTVVIPAGAGGSFDITDTVTTTTIDTDGVGTVTFGDTTTILLEVTGATVSADARISAVAGNVLADNSGLYVATGAGATFDITDGVTTETIIANGTETITFAESDTVDTNVTGNTVTHDVKISTDVGNQLQQGTDNALFVPAQSLGAVADTQTIDLDDTGATLTADVVFSPEPDNQASNALSDGVYVPKGAGMSFDVTTGDLVTFQVTDELAMTFADGDTVVNTFSSPRTITHEAKLSTDVGNQLQQGTDNALHVPEGAGGSFTISDGVINTTVDTDGTDTVQFGDTGSVEMTLTSFTVSAAVVLSSDADNDIIFGVDGGIYLDAGNTTHSDNQVVAPTGDYDVLSPPTAPVSPPGSPSAGDTHIEPWNNGIAFWEYDGATWTPTFGKDNDLSVVAATPGTLVSFVRTAPTTTAPDDLKVGDVIFELYDDGFSFYTWTSAGTWATTHSELGAATDTNTSFHDETGGNFNPLASTPVTVPTSPKAEDTVIERFDNGLAFWTYNGATWDHNWLFAGAGGGGGSFDITDGTTTQTVNPGDTITFVSDGTIDFTVSAVDAVNAEVALSTDADQRLAIGTDSALYAKADFSYCADESEQNFNPADTAPLNPPALPATDDIVVEIFADTVIYWSYNGATWDLDLNTGTPPGSDTLFYINDERGVNGSGNSTPLNPPGAAVTDDVLFELFDDGIAYWIYNGATWDLDHFNTTSPSFTAASFIIRSEQTTTYDSDSPPAAPLNAPGSPLENDKHLERYGNAILFWEYNGAAWTLCFAFEADRDTNTIHYQYSHIGTSFNELAPPTIPPSTLPTALHELDTLTEFYDNGVVYWTHNGVSWIVEHFLEISTLTDTNTIHWLLDEEGANFPPANTEPASPPPPLSVEVGHTAEEKWDDKIVMWSYDGAAWTKLWEVDITGVSGNPAPVALWAPTAYNGATSEWSLEAFAGLGLTTGTITTYAWSSSDGGATFGTPAAATTTLTFTDDEPYTVTLQVTNAQAETHTFTQRLRNLTSDFRAIPTGAFADADNPTAGEFNTWLTANAGDGYEGTIYYYNRPIGSGTAVLPDYAYRVTEGGDFIRIYEPSNAGDDPAPVALWGVTAFDGVLTYSFEAFPGLGHSANSITNYTWTTNDGTAVIGTPTASTTDITFTDDNDYTVSLQVQDTSGSLHTYTSLVEFRPVDMQLEMAYRVDDDAEHELPLFHFTTVPYSSEGAITDISWTFTRPSDAGTVFTFNGAPAADASAETYVVSGTYANPIIQGFCGTVDVDIEIDDGTTTRLFAYRLDALGVNSLSSRVWGEATLNGGLDVSTVEPFVVTSSAESGAGTLDDAFSIKSRPVYITFDPLLDGATITLTGIMNNDISNFVLDGRTNKVTVTGDVVQVDYVRNAIVAYMHFEDPGAAGVPDNLAFRNFFDGDANIFLHRNHFEHPHNILLDAGCDIGWNQGNDVYVTQDFCKYVNVWKAMLIGFGTELDPNEGGNYYYSGARNHWYKCGQRLPGLRNGRATTINDFIEKWGEEDDGVFAHNVSHEATFLLVENMVITYAIGETHRTGNPVINPTNNYVGPTPDGDFRVIGGWYLTNVDQSILRPENNPELVHEMQWPLPPYGIVPADNGLLEAVRDGSGDAYYDLGEQSPSDDEREIEGVKMLGTLIMDGFNISNPGTVDGRNIANDGDDLDDLVTLTGRPANSVDLGTFTGSTISDNVDIKTALQELETAGTGGHVHNLDDLGDVNAPAPSDGEALVWNNTAGEWQATGVAGSGDMLKSVYDTGDDGRVDNAEQLNDGTFTFTADDSNDMVLLSGVAKGDQDLGTFTGTTITDNVAIKVAIQELETEVETKSDSAHTHAVDDLSDVNAPTPLDGEVLTWDNTGGEWIASAPAGTGDMLKSVYDTGDDGRVDNAEQLNDGTFTFTADDSNDLIVLTGVAKGFQDLGTFTGSTIADNETVKGALQDLETDVEARATQVAFDELEQDVNDLITLSGVAENATDLGTFTGAVIADSSTIKDALQALEVAVEAQISSLPDIMEDVGGAASSATGAGVFDPGNFYLVTNTDTSGAGSLYDAVLSSRYIVIDPSLAWMTLTLNANLQIPANTTIDGRLAPGYMIDTGNFAVLIENDNVVLTNLSVLASGTGGTTDAITIQNGADLIVLSHIECHTPVNGSVLGVDGSDQRALLYYRNSAGTTQQRMTVHRSVFMHAQNAIYIADPSGAGEDASDPYEVTFEYCVFEDNFSRSPFVSHGWVHIHHCVFLGWGTSGGSCVFTGTDGEALVEYNYFIPRAAREIVGYTGNKIYGAFNVTPVSGTGAYQHTSNLLAINLTEDATATEGPDVGVVAAAGYTYNTSAMSEEMAVQICRDAGPESLRPSAYRDSVGDTILSLLFGGTMPHFILETVNRLVEQSGLAYNALGTLGIFTGSTISSFTSIKGALQDIETAYEETDTNVDDLIALSGVAENATDLGAFSGTTITDNVDVKVALQELETAVEAGGVANLDDIGDVNAPTPADGQVLTWDSTPGEWVSSTPAGSGDMLKSVYDTGDDGRVDNAEQLNDGTFTFTADDSNDMVVLTGVAKGAQNLGTFTGATISDNTTIKAALQELETETETKAAASTVTEIDANVDDLITLSGVAENATDLGTFTGTTITDNTVVKTALQELETEVETKAATSTVTEIDANADDLITLSGVAENATDLGTFTGTTISNNTTIKGALQDMETAHELKADSSVVTEIDANVDDLITLSGVAENTTHLGTFTGATITDSVAIKTALQELETAVETKADSSTVTEIDGNVDDLITLSGVAENATNLGTFTGTTITDNVAVKTALQELETEVELKATTATVTEIDANVDDLITLSGVAENATHLGTFTGTTITDNVAVKTALQELETEVETKADSSTVTEIDANVDDLITLSGVAENATHLGTFTGTTITDSVAVKVALQELETEVETKADSSTVTEIDGNVDDLITLSGVAENATHLGTFTGTTITDNVAVKTALQELETAVEAGGVSSLDNIGDVNVPTPADGQVLTWVNVSGEWQATTPAGSGDMLKSVYDTGDDGRVDNAEQLNDGTFTFTADDSNDMVVLTGVAKGAQNLGTFTGTTITDSVTVKAALQELETEVETKAASSTVTEIDGNVDDLITLSGVAENATNLGTFTGTTITDNVTVKAALQELETGVEGKADASHTHAAADVTTGTFADARIAQSNVTQHEAAIDHDALTNYVAAEHVSFTEGVVASRPAAGVSGRYYYATDEEKLYHDNGATWDSLIAVPDTHVHDTADVTTGTFADARIAQTNVTQHEAAIDHDALTNYVAAEHVSITEGVVASRPAAGTAGRYYYATDENKLYHDNGATWDLLVATPDTHVHDTADVTTGTFADARIAQSNVTQHEAAIDHDALTNYVAAEHVSITEGVVASRPAAGTAGRYYYATDENKLYHDNGATWDLLVATPDTHVHDTADVTTGTFADARIAQSNVTQHEAAIDHDALTNYVAAEHVSITEGVVASRPAAGTAGRYYYATDENKLYHDNGATWDLLVATPDTHVHDTADVTTGTFADARIAQSNVTQHEAAIDHDALTNYVAAEHVSITEGVVASRPAAGTAGRYYYATDENKLYHDNGVTWDLLVATPDTHVHDTADVTTGTFADARISQSSVTQHNAALDHGTLAGLADDDHTQYHTDARALTWIGTIDLDDVGDVNAPTPSDGQVLTWVNASTEWQATTPAGSGDMLKSVYDTGDDGRVDNAEQLNDGVNTFTANDSADMVVLTGVAKGAINLGTFTGTTITDNVTIKAALQELETEVETKAATSVVTEIDTNANDLITLTGVAENVTNLGTFTGTTITDNLAIKPALQELETAVEARATSATVTEIDVNVNDLITLTGVAENVTTLGTFTGTTITDNVAIKTALQELETEVELKATTATVTEIDANVDDLITLSGVAENATNLGTFTGTTITDNVAIKTALQELETEVETKAGTSHTHAAADITSGTFADARIAASNVTQHVGSIDHDATLNFVANEHIDWTAVSAGTIDTSNLPFGTAGQQLTTNEAETALEFSLASKYLSVRKGSAGTITAGQVVYVSGYNVGGSYIEVELAEADVAASMPAVGVAFESIDNTANKRVLLVGNASGIIDTSSYSVGDNLYVSETAGALTNVRPTAATTKVQKVGTVVRSHVSLGEVIITGAGRSNDVPNQMEDTVFRVVDNTDNTKAVVFELSGVTTATTRTLTIPDESGTISLTNHTHATLSDVELNDYSTNNTNTASSGTAVTLDYTTGSSFSVTLTDNCTFTFSNPPASGERGDFTLILTQDSTPRTVTWPTGVDWPGGTAPTISTGSGARDAFQFFTIDGGTIWYGVTIGQAFA